MVMKHAIYDCSTNETTIVDFTADEEAAAVVSAEAQAVAQAAAETAATQAATDKASGNAKLKALGLTDAEIAVLVG